MALTVDLISKFVKATNDTKKTKKDSTVYGTTVEYNGSIYVKIDGSDRLTPISSTADLKPDERVIVMIKNHTAIVTGNMSSPSASTSSVKDVGNQVTDVEILVANKVDTDVFVAEQARVDILVVDNVTIKEKLAADEAEIGKLQATNITVSEKLTAAEADIDNLQANKIDVTIADAKYATIEELDATNANLHNLESTYGDFVVLTTNKFTAMDAKINDLAVGDFDAVYANIDFSNIGEAAMEYFYSQSGLIKDVVVGDGTITGELVGVTIKGDLLEGNTVIADKLVIKGEDGLYYKLNTDGVSVEKDQTAYNSLNGSVILAKSITASKISVDDLVAFDATIGGFNISETSLYSGVKASVDNTTSGVYLDKDGQMAIGDANNFLKYYKDTDGAYKLAISAASVIFSTGKNIEDAITDAGKTASDFMSYDSTNGLQVGNKSKGTWTGFRTQITSTAFNILDSAGRALASYGAKLIELGKNATDAIIKLCGGKGQIEYVTDEDDSYLQISADKPRIKGTEMASVYSAYTNNSTRWEKAAVNVTPTRVHIYSSECIDPTLYDMIEGWNTTDVIVDPDRVYLGTPGDVDIEAEGDINLRGASVNDSYGQFESVVTGSSGIWKYRKYANGDVELDGIYNVSNKACNTALGGWYRTDVFSIGSFPFSVYNAALTANYESAGYGAVLWATSVTSSTQPPSYYLIRPTSATIASGKIIIHVRGRWM